MAAFYFGDKNVQATLAGMELLIELFLYNLQGNRLKDDVKMRLAVHTGSTTFATNVATLAGDAINQVEQLESRLTKPNTVTLSPGALSDLGSKLSPFFKPFDAGTRTKLHRFEITWEP